MSASRARTAGGLFCRRYRAAIHRVDLAARWPRVLVRSQLQIWRGKNPHSEKTSKSASCVAVRCFGRWLYGLLIPPGDGRRARAATARGSHDACRRRQRIAGADRDRPGAARRRRRSCSSSNGRRSPACSASKSCHSPGSSTAKSAIQTGRMLAADVVAVYEPSGGAVAGGGIRRLRR